MERYHYFVSSYRQFGFNCKSRSELKCDESEDDGALATVLEVLKRVHSIFFDTVCPFRLFQFNQVLYALLILLW